MPKGRCTGNGHRRARRNPWRPPRRADPRPLSDLTARADPTANGLIAFAGGAPVLAGDLRDRWWPEVAKSVRPAWRRCDRGMADGIGVTPPADQPEERAGVDIARGDIGMSTDWRRGQRRPATLRRDRSQFSPSSSTDHRRPARHSTQGFNKALHRQRCRRPSTAVMAAGSSCRWVQPETVAQVQST